jgi:hypothetical protein
MSNISVNFIYFVSSNLYLLSSLFQRRSEMTEVPVFLKKEDVPLMCPQCHNFGNARYPADCVTNTEKIKYLVTTFAVSEV